MAIISIGPGQQFNNIASAVAASRDGDVLQVQAGIYTNDFATINTRITIEGIGGMATLRATVQPPNGKGILVTNTDVTLDNLELVGATVPDGNGAGIRYQGGDLLITDSYVHGNQNGLLGNPVPDGTITIRNSEFASNGVGNGATHNIYVGDLASLTIEDSYIHDASVGHQVKSRAAVTTIIGSRILDGATGTGSYSIDLPNGGRAVLKDNVIQQSANSLNPAIVHFGGEGEVHRGSSLEITNTTVVNELVSVSSRLLLNQTAVEAMISDIASFGLDEIATGPAVIRGWEKLNVLPSLGVPVTGGDEPDNEPDNKGEGSAVLTGTAGADIVRGTAGADNILGGGDGDRLVGGLGADRFMFTEPAAKRDVILDFNTAEGDRVDLGALFPGTELDLQDLLASGALTVTQRPWGVRIGLNGTPGVDLGEPLVALRGATLSELGSDFLLV